MSDQDRISDYLKRLERVLPKASGIDCNDIVNEISTHLEQRAEQGRLDEAMAALGTPQACARGYFEELKVQEAFTDGGIAKTMHALIVLAPRRIVAAIGLFVSVIFYMVSFGFALTAIVEVIAPSFAGFWMDKELGGFIFGISNAASSVGMTEILGRWMFPFAAGLAIFALICGQWIGRYFVSWLAKERPFDTA